MSFKYVSPKELKELKKERLEHMKNAEKALKDEDYDSVIGHFKKIIEISEYIDDDDIKNEFLEKLEFLTSRMSQTGSVTQAIPSATSIADFIDDLIKAPNRIIKKFAQPIEIAAGGGRIAPARAVPAPEVPTARPLGETLTPATRITAPADIRAPSSSSRPITPVPIKPTTQPPVKPRPPIPIKPISQIPPKPLPSTPIKPISQIPPKPLPSTPTKPISQIPPKPLPSTPITPITPISPKPGPPIPMKSIQKNGTIDLSDIEEEIKKMGSVEDQLKELKKILEKQDEKKIKT